MSNQSKPERKPTDNRLIDNKSIVVDDITNWYPQESNKRQKVIQHLSVETNLNINLKQYFAELEALGIPAENVCISFCG